MPESADSAQKPNLSISEDKIDRLSGQSSTIRTLSPCNLSGKISGFVVWFGESFITVVNVNFDPFPNSLSTNICPFISSTICWLIHNPRPVPPNLRVVEVSPWVNAWKRISRWSLCIPMPVSWTEHVSRIASGRIFSLLTSIRTIPFLSVNFMALLSKFVKICWYFSESPIMSIGVFSLMSRSSSMSFSAVILEKIVTAFWSIASSLKFWLSRTMFPESILEKSRISSITPSRALPDEWMIFR